MVVNLVANATRVVMEANGDLLIGVGMEAFFRLLPSSEVVSAFFECQVCLADGSESFAPGTFCPSLYLSGPQ